MNELLALIAANAIPTTVDSRLLISVNSTYETGEYTVNIRTTTERDDGTISQNFDQIIAQANGGTILKINPGPGKLIAISAFTVAAGVKYGKLFAVIELLRIIATNDSSRLPIAAGYVTDQDFVSWPLIRPLSPLELQGGTDTATPAQPAAGAELNIILGTIQNTDVIGGKFDLETDATVATRTPVLIISVNGSDIIAVASRTTFLAGVVRTCYLWVGPNLPADTADRLYFPVPNSLLGKNVVIKTQTTNIQAGDQYSAVEIAYRGKYEPN